MDWTAAEWVAVLAVVIPATLALALVALNGIRAERSRRREIYGAALAATFEYREFAYVVRRRERSMAAEERIRISEGLRVVHGNLDHYLALLRTERSRQVEAKYELLVAEARRLAGGYIQKSWKDSGIDSDAEMNMTGIDFSRLTTFVDAYLAAVRRTSPGGASNF